MVTMKIKCWVSHILFYNSKNRHLKFWNLSPQGLISSSLYSLPYLQPHEEIPKKFFSIFMTGIISWIKPKAGQGWPLGTFSKCKHNEVKKGFALTLPSASFDCWNSSFTLFLLCQPSAYKLWLESYKLIFHTKSPRKLSVKTCNWY